MAEARVAREVEAMVPALAHIANQAVKLDPQEFGKPDVARAVRALGQAVGPVEARAALVDLGAVALAWVHRLNTDMEEAA